MLHILLLILKIIGIILAAILGILVLLICIVLFVPVRYEVMGKGDGSPESLKAKVRITWLLHLVAVDIYYKNQQLRWRVRAAWIKKTGGRGIEVNGNDAGKDIREETQEYEKNEERHWEALESKEALHETGREPEETCEDEEDASEEREGIEEKIQKIYRKIAAWFQKIKCIFSGLCDKIKALLEKKDKIAAFIEDEVHVNAFLRVKKEVFGYLRRLKPKKADVKLVYGFEDPYRTGQVLAGFSVLYPFIGEYTSITPDFENRVLKGSADIKGNLYAGHIVMLCLKLILSKNVRTTYKHIKNFEL